MIPIMYSDSCVTCACWLHVRRYEWLKACSLRHCKKKRILRITGVSKVTRALNSVLSTLLWVVIVYTPPFLWWLIRCIATFILTHDMNYAEEKRACMSRSTMSQKYVLLHFDILYWKSGSMKLYANWANFQLLISSFIHKCRQALT